MLKRFAFAALPIAFAASGAQAQQARYCEGRIVANSFYSIVSSNGSRAVVSYFVQLQNQSGAAIRYTVRFTAPQVVEAQNGGAVANLLSYQQATVTLARQNFNNPSGAGQLSPADLIRITQVQCPR